MNKKINLTVFSLSLFLIAVGTTCILFIPQILNWLPDFLETQVFHRTFNHEAYRETMVSLVSYPIFFAILLDAIFFIWFSDKQKNTVIAFYLASILLTLVVTSYTCANSFTDQDLSSETLFALECFKAKTFWPTTWYYSMEFRFLNTQLLTVPLFLFTKNLALIRAITAVLCELALFGATWFLLHELKIKQTWLKFLCCTLIISPVSWTFFTVVQEGSYYIPHIMFSFFYVGMFLSIVFHAERHTQKKNLILTIVFFVLAFLSGLSSIRYILNFVFPVWAVSATYMFYNERKQNVAFNFKSFFVENKQNKTASIALLLSGFGYICNSFILSSIFTFKNMNKIRFNSLNEMTVDGIKNMLLDTAGFNGNVSVFTPGGVANILLFVVTIFMVMGIIELLKGKTSSDIRFFLHYAIFFFFFHLYTNICTEMTGRYFTMVFVFLIPIIAVTVENTEITSLKKWILTASVSVLILTNGYLCFGKMQTADRSLKLDGVCKYLTENDYEFGYAFSNIANCIWFWTNGKIEVASISSDSIDGTNVLPKKYSIHKWLEPKKYQDKNYYKGEKHVFFVIKQEEYKLSVNKSVINSGNLVFEDSDYLIFEYDSTQKFIEAFSK